MDYQQYRVEDFVLDEAFRKWVLDPDKASRIFWSQWLDKHPQKATTVAQAIELLRQLSVQQDSLSAQQQSSLTQAIEEGINRWEKTAQKPIKYQKAVPISAYAMTRQKLEASLPHKRKSNAELLKIAACVAFVISMLYGGYREVLNEQPQPEIVYEQVVKENPIGQKLTVFLADGSKVILNAGSKLRFTKPFHPDRRLVTLEGEAFFEVAHDSLRPFQVSSGALTTTALGTSFNVTAYPKENRVQVALTSGRVKVHRQAAEKPMSDVYYLEPGEQVRYDKAQHTVAKTPFDATKVLAWKAGVLCLEHADQATVLRRLERWYGVPIKVAGKSPAAWDITATFNNQSLKSVLTSLSYTMSFDFEITEDQVFIRY